MVECKESSSGSVVGDVNECNVDNGVHLRSVNLFLVLPHPFMFRVLQILLEAETDNVAALRLYENLGFIRERRLFRYYLNGQDAFRLQLLLD